MVSNKGQFFRHQCCLERKCLDSVVLKDPFPDSCAFCPDHVCSLGAPGPPPTQPPALHSPGTNPRASAHRPRRACFLPPDPGAQSPCIQGAGPQSPSSPPHRRASRCVCVIAARHATTGARVKMAAAVLSGPSAGSAAGVPGGAGGLSAVGSGPRLRMLLLESVSGLLQPRAGSAIPPVHPPARSAPHLPGLMCLLRLHGTVGGAQVSL